MIAKDKVPKPIVSEIVDLRKPEQLHGLAERTVAVESVVFLSKQYEFLQEYMEYLVPPQNKIILQQFFSQVRLVKCCSKLIGDLSSCKFDRPITIFPNTFQIIFLNDLNY